MAVGWHGRLAALASVLALAGCEGGSGLPAFLGGTATGSADRATSSAGAPVRLVERDVEAPEVFKATEPGLWDGRPSLGGVWVAYPDVTDPERVIIRNTETGSSVIGALFRRERETPGPALQVSSDAAAALGMLAGAPTPLDVTALRREEVPEVDPAAQAAAEADAETSGAIATGAIEERPLADVTTAAAAAIAAAETTAPAPPAAAAPAAAPAPATHPRPFLQIGIFSVEGNADNAAGALRRDGVVPTIRREESQGKTFWRVVVGPVSAPSERDTMLAKVRRLGFADAYFVSN